MSWRPWSSAMAEALYGPAGFYRTGGGPAAHFRTSVHASGLFAVAVGRLAAEVDDALGQPSGFAVVDVGAGGGELLRALRPAVPARWRLCGVDVAGRPADLPAGVDWHAEVADLPPVTGLVVANEWLDNVPVDVVAGGRTVLVDERGTERAGRAAPEADLAWLRRWWPSARRAEVGRRRDEAWAALVGRMRRGVAVAVDYAVVPGLHDGGTLTGYRAGRQVVPVPDGSCDLTAHVLLESCAAAGAAAAGRTGVLLTQRAALRALGVDGRLPPVSLASTDPAAYATALQRASEAAELIAPGGLGGFRWLVQAAGTALPVSLRTAAAVDEMTEC